MSTYTVNCPECGKCFEYGDVRETVFCSSCGKKLRIYWKIDRVTLDNGLPAGPVAAAASAPAQRPQQNTYDGEVPKGYLRVIINMPLDCLDLKGSFSHYFIRWDDKEIGIAGKGENVTLRTLSRVHKLEITQVNKKKVGSSNKTEVFQVPVNNDRILNIKIEGDGFAVE